MIFFYVFLPPEPGAVVATMEIPYPEPPNDSWKDMAFFSCGNRPLVPTREVSRLPHSRPLKHCRSEAGR